MSISVVGRDIYIDQFDCGVDINFNLKNLDDTPYDLTGYTAQFIVKVNKDDADSLAVENLQLTGVDSVLVVPINKELSANEHGVYYYAIRLFKSDVFVNTVVQGKLKILNNTFEQGVE